MSPGGNDSERLAADVEAAALALGFDLAGITHAEGDADTRFIHEWLARGYGGEMHYLARRAEERADPQQVLPGAKSVIVVATDYDTRSGPDDHAGIGGPGEGDPSRGVVARYARGDDYHEVMLDRLRALGAALEPLAGRPVSWRAYVDTGPVAERVFAARAGIGWLGKNTCLIHPDLGSFVFLGVLLCDLDLAHGAPIADQCGTCTACLDACPTDAFAKPGLLDATRCIAYTTIESDDAVPEALRSGHGDRVFGCDICQDVCPWNQRRGRARPGDALGLRTRLAPRPEWAAPTLAELLALDDGAFRDSTRRSPVRRAGLAGLLRNALVAAGNSGDRALLPAVEALCGDADPVVSESAGWARLRLERDE